MVKLIRALGFFNAILDSLFIALGVFALLVRSFVKSILVVVAPTDTVNMITTLMTYTGLILVVFFGLGLVFTILVLIRSFQKGE